MNGISQQWLPILAFVMIVLGTESFDIVNITYVKIAEAKGAVCLDGSPPAYHLDWGFGVGVNNWIVHIQGGAWCENVTSCIARKSTQYGTSNLMEKQINFTGILSNVPQFNPDFYNWNRVKMRYCDGSSFTGDIEAVDPDTKTYYRGARIFRATMEELLEKGMKSAQIAILSGCSAGGLTSILHCDNFKALFPATTKVKCLADAGFFMNLEDIGGTPHLQNFFDGVVATHGSAKNLPQSCTSKMKPSLCFFPQNVAKEIQTPLFIINSEIDSWQIANILVPDIVDPSGSWNNCNTDLRNCSDSQLQVIQEFGKEFVNAIHGLGDSKSRGYFIDSCYRHCHAEFQDMWFNSTAPKLGNKTLSQAVGDWVYDRSPFQHIDHPYPCDSACNNLI